MSRDTKFPDLERRYEQKLAQNTYAVIRVDGNNFSKFTRQFERPFSAPFAGAMNAVAQRLADFVPGVLFAYAQSDEASVVFTDLHSEAFEYAFAGRVSKLVSLAAANATAAFMTSLPDTNGLPLFDARVFTLDSFEDVTAYLHYRRLDARKNAITMAASTLRSHNELMGMSTADRGDVLATSGFGLIPEGYFNGRLVHPIEVEEQVEFTRGGVAQHVTVQRRRWLTEDATLATSEIVLAAAQARLTATGTVGVDA